MMSRRTQIALGIVVALLFAAIIISLMLAAANEAWDVWLWRDVLGVLS